MRRAHKAALDVKVRMADAEYDRVINPGGGGRVVAAAPSASWGDLQLSRPKAAKALAPANDARRPAAAPPAAAVRDDESEDAYSDDVESDASESLASAPLAPRRR